ncbi:hypothetical protein H7F51_11540 [Novosphingobium flavum]|uniref:Uncharacterized protein n=1 Tax=Novosphingobium flavum TaxID=1778672 RepID=A0A7X1FSG8_9SPHN|nr:hypothetical protein [Novosphingobium flavum]MBC2666151.1 hypothetical protein [Novosphingobium flavum]
MSKFRTPATLALAASLLTPVRAGAAPAPDVAAIPGNRNLTGSWEMVRQTGFGPKQTREGVTYVVYPYTPEFQKDYEHRIQEEIEGRPVQPAGSTCLPSGLGRMMTVSGVIEIFQSADQVVAHKENQALMRVFLNRGHLPADELDPTFYGDSVGHWEGDVLVVDTIGLGAQPYIDGRAIYSEQAHIMQRIRRIDEETLEVTITIEDPKAFTRPITSTATHKLLRNYEMGEYYCTNERHRFAPGADQSVVLKP